MTGGDVTLRIDRIAVEIGEERLARQAEETVRKALVLLGARLAGAPFELGDRAPVLALRRLDLGPLDPGWIGSPGAADRLAGDLYERLIDQAGGESDGHRR